jgi:single-strand DNA-binding protein
VAGSVNKVVLIGRLGQDPEIKTTNQDKKIAQLSIATSETWRDRNTGERKERTEWHRVVCFNEGLAKVIQQYAKKGGLVYVEGELATRKWQDRDGNDRYSTEILIRGYNHRFDLLGGGSGQRGPQGEADYGYGDAGQPGDGGSAKTNPDLDDEVPF